jgi:putative tryptophan/tyrosine transport system substrate-binding protein
MSGIKRREFITLLGGAAAASSLSARAQQAAKVPRVGFLFYGSPELSPEVDAFRQGLRELGYIEGQNITLSIDLRGGGLSNCPSLHPS